jgi:hypothetical protein
MKFFSSSGPTHYYLVFDARNACDMVSSRPNEFSRRIVCDNRNPALYEFSCHLWQAVVVAIDGSKFKAVNTRDRNFTQAKMQRRLAQIDESIARYLSQLDSADR